MQALCYLTSDALFGSLTTVPCSPCITCVQYRGGHHDACGGISRVPWAVFKTVGDIMSTVGDIMSTVGDIMMPVGGYHDVRRGIS